MTDDVLQRLGPPAKIGPPLRTEQDRLTLWKGIEEGSIDVVASDHAPKAKKKDDPFFEAPYGAPGAETMLTVTYDEGVNTGRIGPCKIAQVLSENPAKIFGLYPEKGAIRKGADADLVLFDPNQAITLQAANLHSGAGYTPFEGRTCLGKLVLTMQRGRIVVEDGVLKQKPGAAKFLPTKISKTTL
jgi:dihydroorotase-like cyclic amidohydrolase